eukprot:gene7446-biopygen9083
MGFQGFPGIGKTPGGKEGFPGTILENPHENEGGWKGNPLAREIVAPQKAGRASGARVRRASRVAHVPPARVAVLPVPPPPPSPAPQPLVDRTPSTLNSAAFGHRWAGRAQGVGGRAVRLSLSPRAEQSSTGCSSFAPRCEPPRARSPGAKMIRMGSGSPAFQRVSRATLNCILDPCPLACEFRPLAHFGIAP